MIHVLNYSDRPEVSVCIPTLNAKQDHVQKTLASIRAYTQSIDYEIVIYDCEGVLCGYTAPQNKAMAAGKGRFLVAMNDDVIVSPGWLDPLMRAITQQVWCVSPDMTHTDGPQIFAPYCMLWARESWYFMNGLDERYIFWCSDIDCARRLVDVRRPPVKVKLPVSIQHGLNTTASIPEHSEWFNRVCRQDLDRFYSKWGINAEDEKHRLAALCSE